MNSRNEKQPQQQRKKPAEGASGAETGAEQYVSPSQPCSGAQRDQCLLWTVERLPKHKPEALSFLLQKLGQQSQKVPCNSHACSQARTSDGIATSMPTREQRSITGCTQQLFHCFMDSLTVFHRLFHG